MSKVTKVPQDEYHLKCEAAYKRYRATITTTGEANMNFAIELQGYLKALVNDAHTPVNEAVEVVIGLMKLYAKTNELKLQLTNKSALRQRAARKDCSIESLERGIEKERDLPHGMIKAYYANGRKARYTSTVERVKKSFQ